MQVLWRKNCTIKINDYLLHVNYNFCLGFGECKRSRQDWTKGMRKGSLPSQNVVNTGITVVNKVSLKKYLKFILK